MEGGGGLHLGNGGSATSSPMTPFSAIIGRGNSTMVKMMTKMTMTLTTVNMKMTGTMMITTMRMTGLSPPSLVDHQIHRPKADDLRPKSSVSGLTE